MMLAWEALGYVALLKVVILVPLIYNLRVSVEVAFAESYTFIHLTTVYLT